ncbi:hypothetical protein [Stutzerimonas stutzeri]|uniref:hypothetical protein n=1 Tax=Stutzerimonas stutzeri TaxID=316 RepID=UPI0015E17456|nr:hypothetical protein [Stutzerimonas stutzeri]MCQ4265182.1 hypothetical protein [Stutzerimonas stutzeri]
MNGSMSVLTNALAPGRSQKHRLGKTGENSMLKFIGGTAGIIFIIGLIVVIGIFKLLF